MKILRITLEKKWFNMTDSGEKKEEYRKIKPYWISRLCHKHDGTIGGDLHDVHKLVSYTIRQDFDFIFARNGYNVDCKNWTRKCEGIKIGEGKPEWGAEPGEIYFVIKLGEKILKPLN